MIKQNFKVICHIPDKTKSVGYLLLMSKGRQNRKRISTGISIDPDKFKRFWNHVKQQFKSGLENYKLYNQKIEKVIEDNTKQDGKELAPPVKVISGSFLKYWDNQIELTENQGSKGKHIVVKRKLEKYLQSINKKDISFNDLTPDFVKHIHHNFKTDKSLTTSSVNSYMKLINNVVRRKIKDAPYTFPVNPFASIKYDTKINVKRKVLNEDEVSRLLTTKITDTELDLVRDMFVFQIFASGMRVSDLCLLRWNTINVDGVPQLDYFMFKTRHEQESPLTYYLCKALLKVIGESEYFNSRFGLYKFIVGGTLLGSEVEIDEEGRAVDDDGRNKVLFELEEDLKEYLLDKDNDEAIDYKGYFIKKENAGNTKELIDAILKSKQKFIKSLIPMTANKITNYVEKNKCNNGFVFPILKSADFKNLSDEDLKFKDIVSKDADLKHKLEYGKKIYRRKLDKVAKLCKLNDVITHTARHTFTQLMINAGAQSYHIKDELGHTTLAVTDSYIRHKNFKNKKGESFSEMVGNKTDYLDND